ncbi:ABC transporter ATP-binding protein [Streptococcus hyovaginalis]|uniref:ABC transporter ATP-binding protein n=1 Tax=Streptococcus hyovaginalis TaxID=149015 RepID=UPI000408BDE7|nr:ABC transporter ATP-binding protein [Streptococcus hyovaginalis]
MLKIKKISKQFKGNDFYSLQDVSMEINKGEIVGLIGKNGAGKSTLMKMMAKSLKPTSGVITYNGVDINSQDNILIDFGIMIDPVFYPEMSVVDNLKFYLKLHGKEELYPNIESTLKLVELWNARNRKPKGFSFGMKQRTALAIAMVAEPDFLILDEPFVGLDPIGVQKLIDILKKWSSERQISMLISSHQLGELEALCSRYVYIEGGKLADSFEGSEHPSVVVHLDSTKNMEILNPLLSDTINLTDNLLDISTGTTSEDLNKIFGVLGEQELIFKIEVKENHLKEIFNKGA